jgi:hypothetical protein
MILTILVTPLFLSPFFKKKRNRHWTDEWYKGIPHYTHENRMTVKADSAKRLQKHLWFGGPPFDDTLETVTPIIAKRNSNVREAGTLSQRLFVTLCYFDAVNTSEDLRVTSALQDSSMRWN